MKYIRLTFMALAAMLIANTPTLAQGPQQTIRLCTGGTTGNYYAAGKVIKEMASKSVDIEVIETEGTIDNLDRTFKLDVSAPDACDALIGQPDGPVYLKRTNPASVATLRQVGELHREYLHALCSKASGVDDLGDLEGTDKYSVAIGDAGSGAWLIWQNIVAEDDGYAKVPTSSEGGDLALSSVASDNVSCMLQPAGLGNGVVNKASDLLSDKLALVPANDKDFNDALDVRGKPLYSYDHDIEGSEAVYKKLLCGTFSCDDVSTISWNAGVYVNTERLSKAQLTGLVDAVMRATPRIVGAFGG